MLDVDTYLRLLPKAELHCHFVSTIRVSTLVELCSRNNVPLRTDDLNSLLSYPGGLPDFLSVFNAAHAALTRPEDIARVAVEGVEDAVRAGNLRYREYFVNPDNFVANGFDYPTLIDAMIDGLAAAERTFGVGFRIVPAINRSLPPATAVALVESMILHPRESVVGLGQDDLTPELTEDPLRFREAYALARSHGFRVSAHVGETMAATPSDVLDAAATLQLDRIDHGYRVVDDADALAQIKAMGIPFTCTPHSTELLSGWPLDRDHRIAAMISAGLPVTLATDDAVFFSTDIGREYAALPALGFGPVDAARIARAGFEAAWCDEQEKARRLAEVDSLTLALTAALSSP